MTSRKVWALWSSRVDPYSEHELVGLFAAEDVAETVRANLIGKPRNRDYLFGRWADDEDFPDLYVRPLDVWPGA
jgi:hypothetical protein